jgi:hypothetical protein
MSRYLSAVSIVAILSGCTGPGAPTCAAGSPSGIFTLYFGKAIHSRGDLTNREWKAFLDDTVTANLPNGYTVIDANGAWMNPATRKTTGEGTKVLVVALPDVSDGLTTVNRIRTAYQVRFHQQLVGLTVQPACAEF